MKKIQTSPLVIPAKAGIQQEKQVGTQSLVVIPAQAGIQCIYLTVLPHSRERRSDTGRLR